MRLPYPYQIEMDPARNFNVVERLPSLAVQGSTGFASSSHREILLLCFCHSL